MGGRRRMERTGLATVLVVIATIVPRPASAQDTSGPDAAVEPLPRWTIDSGHSRVGFSVRHFFTPVEGGFGEYDIALGFDPEAPERSRVRVTIDAASVDTDNERRDLDLRSENFFEVDAYPELVFESTAVRRAPGDEFIVEGDLTIRDVTRPVELRARVLGIRELTGNMAQYGRMVAGFEVRAVIDRRDFGVGSGRWAETVVLGPDVTIDVLLEARLP